MPIGKNLVAIEVLRTILQNPRITPAEISEKLGMTAQYIRNTLGILTELKIVETPVRGVYLITDLGRYILNYSQTDMALIVDNQKGEKKREV